MPIYADNASTTPVEDKVLAAMLPYFKDCFYNPSSAHHGGLKAKAAVEGARYTIARLIGATQKGDKVIFTSGATESNIIVGLYSGYFISSATEHSSVAGLPLFEIPVLDSGIIDIIAYKNIIYKLYNERGAQLIVVSVALVNNETGVIQDIRELSECSALLERELGITILVHTDATQAIGKTNVSVHSLGVDFMTFAAHKIGGPKGVGALYASERVDERLGLSIGGEQENGSRAGTENVAGIVGFATALKLKIEANNQSRIMSLENRLISNLRNESVDFKLIGTQQKRAPGVMSIEFPGVDAKSMVAALDADGIYISAGSACNSSKFTPPKTLRAMGLGDEAQYVVRISLSEHNTEDEVDIISSSIADAVKTINDIRRRENY